MISHTAQLMYFTEMPTKRSITTEGRLSFLIQLYKQERMLDGKPVYGENTTLLMLPTL